MLRPLQASDVSEAYVSALNDPTVNRFLVGARHTRQTRESVEAYVRENARDPNAVLFGIFAGSGELAGTVRLHGCESIHGTATIGICLFPGYWGRGYSAEAVRAVSEWALSGAGVRYVEAGCYEANARSVSTFLRAGFQPAARFEDKYLLDGRPAPVVFLKKTRGDQPEPQGAA